MSRSTGNQEKSAQGAGKIAWPATCKSGPNEQIAARAASSMGAGLAVRIARADPDEQGDKGKPVMSPRPR